MTYKYNISGKNVERAGEGIGHIPSNRTLIAAQLTDNLPQKPEIVEELQNVEDLFQQFKPAINVELEDETGVSVSQQLHFRYMEDFSIKGIISQSAFLQELTFKEEMYLKVERQLKTNKALKEVLSDPLRTEGLLSCLLSLLKELNDTDPASL